MIKLLRKHRRTIVFVTSCGLLFYSLLVRDILQVKLNVHRNDENQIIFRLQPQLPVQAIQTNDTEHAHKPDTDRRPKKHETLEHKQVPSNDISTHDDGVPKLIIVAYYRGGSSLTGSLFKWNEKIIYYFEPLYFLRMTAVKITSPLYNFNKTKVFPPSRGHDLPFVYQTLEGLLSCKLEAVLKGTILPGLTHMSSIAVKKFRSCYAKHANDEKHLKNVCFKDFENSCLKSDVRVVKEIRLPMESTRELLKTFPSLKLIHLIRDVRGMLCSRSPGSCKMHPEDLKEVCTELYLDIMWRLKLDKEFPGRIMRIRYEDLAENPIQTAESVYEFLDMELPISVAKLLYNSTMIGHEIKGMYETGRADSIATAYNWRKKIHWDTVRDVQKYCEDTLKHGQYPFYSKEKELREAPLPVRKKQSLNDKYKS